MAHAQDSLLGGVLALILFFLLGVGGYYFATLSSSASTEAIARSFTVHEIARLMLTSYLLPFELTSVLLLVAIIGAIVMARRPPEDGDRKQAS